VSIRKAPCTDTDIVISGGGIVGSTLACILARQGLRVALVEASEARSMNDKQEDDLRVLAITPASAQIFKAVGAWRPIEEGDIGYFRRIEVWDANGDGSVCFDSADLCEPTLGYIAANQLIQSALESVIAKHPGITSYRPTAPRKFNLVDDHIAVELEDGISLTARLVVGADGSRSTVRDLAGIENSLHDYHQKALVCVVTTERSHGNVARQRFLATGPLAFLPLADPHQCAIVWSTKPEEATALLGLNEDTFRTALKSAFGGHLGDITWSSSRAAFPLQRAHAKRYCQQRVVLVGDAAHCVHPLAGQGANLGLLDAATLAEVLDDASAASCDIGGLSTLRRYERWRKGENLAMMMFLDGLNHLFANQFGPVQWARNLGLDVVNAIEPMKHWFMRRAMGLAGDLPRLARVVS